MDVDYSVQLELDAIAFAPFRDAEEPDHISSVVAPPNLLVGLRIEGITHYSVGDGLRAWMRVNRSTELAAKIQSKLDNQGFLTSGDLNPFIYREILNAINHDEPEVKGILVDRYPRCIEQLDSFGTWPFQDAVPLAPGGDGNISLDMKPDLVLSFQITKDNARARYLSRGRDTNDSADKFEKRFTEYELETLPVEEEYRKRGILVSVDVNGTKEENIEALTQSLSKSETWQKAILRS